MAGTPSTRDCALHYETETQKIGFVNVFHLEDHGIALSGIIRLVLFGCFGCSVLPVEQPFVPREGGLARLVGDSGEETRRASYEMISELRVDELNESDVSSMGALSIIVRARGISSVIRLEKLFIMPLNLKQFGLTLPTFFAVATTAKAIMLLSSQLQLKGDSKSSKFSRVLFLKRQKERMYYRNDPVRVQS